MTAWQRSACSGVPFLSSARSPTMQTRPPAGLGEQIPSERLPASMCRTVPGKWSLSLAVAALVDELAVVRAGMAGHGDVLGQVAVVRDARGRFSAGLVDAQDQLPAGLDDLDHLSCQAPVAAADGPRPHHVAVERPLDELGRHEEVVLAPALAEQGRDESVSFRLEVDDADHFRAGLSGSGLRRLLPAGARPLAEGGRRPAPRRARPPRPAA